MRDAKEISCFIYKRTGEVEVILSSRVPAGEPPGIPTVAGLVPVTDVMTREVMCALEDLPIENVIDLLVTKYIGCLPIVDDGGHPIGVITKRDIVEPLAHRVSSADEPPASSALAPHTAGEAMLPLAYTLDEQATVAQAAALMATEDLHHVLVVSQGGRLVGVVSALDIVRWLARNDGVLPTALPGSSRARS